MFGASALSSVLRLLVIGLLLTGIVLRPALAFAEEIHDLTAHAATASAADSGQQHHRAPAPGQDDPSDDGHWHLTHCCGQQAAVLPRLDLGLLVPVTASPIPATTVSFVPTPHPAPFRPPIAA